MHGQAWRGRLERDDGVGVGARQEAFGRGRPAGLLVAGLWLWCVLLISFITARVTLRTAYYIKNNIMIEFRKVSLFCYLYPTSEQAMLLLYSVASEG